MLIIDFYFTAQISHQEGAQNVQFIRNVGTNMLNYVGGDYKKDSISKMQYLKQISQKKKTGIFK